MTTGPSEILESQLAELTDVLRRIDGDEFAAAVAAIGAASKVFLIGRGRNGLALRGFGNRLMQLGRPVEIIGDILTGPVSRGDLIIAASGSGTTAALLDAVTTAHSAGARALALTSSRESPLAQESELTLAISSGLADGSPSTQPLGTLFEQALALVCDALVVGLMERLGVDAAGMRARHATIE